MGGYFLNQDALFEFCFRSTYIQSKNCLHHSSFFLNYRVTLTGIFITAFKKCQADSSSHKCSRCCHPHHGDKLLLPKGVHYWCVKGNFLSQFNNWSEISLNNQKPRFNRVHVIERNSHQTFAELSHRIWYSLTKMFFFLFWSTIA